MAKKKAPIEEINPELIKPDPENVRHQAEEEIEADESFQRLKESVYTYGVLVPLVVKPYNRKGSKYKYILIDGERRLRAALATNLPLVPVHRIEGKELANQMLYAFQIHMLRKEWSRTAQARALLKIIKKVQKDIGTRSEEKLFPILQEKTGYSQNKLKDLLRVMRYIKSDEKLLDEMEDPKRNLKFSHLVQFEASVVEQIEKFFPNIIRDYGIKTIRKKLVQKAKKKVISSTRAPMEELLPLFANATTPDRKKYLSGLIKEFLDKPRRTLKETSRKYELRYPTHKEDLIKFVKEAENTTEELRSILLNINCRQLNHYSNLKRSLFEKIADLVKVLRSVLNKIRD